MSWRPITELTVEELLRTPVEIWRGMHAEREGEPYPMGGWHAFAWPQDTGGWIGTTNKRELRRLIKYEIIETGWTHWRHVSPPPADAEITPLWADLYLGKKRTNR